MPISAIYSSDLLRSRQTAELIAQPLCLSVTVESRLREMNLGDWEGMLGDEIKAQFPQELVERARNPVDARAPRGESPMEVATRVMAAVGEIGLKHCNESVLIVAHGISLAIITCLARSIPLDRLYAYIPNNAKLSHVKWKPSQRVGDHIHRKYSENISLLVQEEV